MAKVVLRFVLILLSVSVILSLFFPNFFPFTQEEAANFVKSYENDKLAFIFIQISQVIVAPISHYFTSILGGYIYGPIDGGILNFIGRVIGQFFAFFLAIYFRSFIKEKFSDLGKLEKFVGTKNDKNIFWKSTLIFAMIALPFFPDDELSYAMGLAGYPVWIFSVVTIFGHLLGSFALAFLGSGEEFTGPLFITLALATVIAFILLVIVAFKIQKKKI